MTENENKKIMLVAEDVAINRLLLKKIFSPEFTILEAVNGVVALEVMRREPHIDILLLDIVMPEKDGFAVLTEMRADPALSDIPVIVATANDDETSQIKAFDLGAEDVFSKPYNGRVLLSRVHNVLDKTESAALKAKLSRQEEMLRIARHDSLTGLYNRDAFAQIATEMISKKPDGYYLISCLDIDNFKVVNDQYGRNVGDRVIKSIAKLFFDFFTYIGDGIACRISADNFAALIPADVDSHIDKLIKRQADELYREGIRTALNVSVGRCVVDDREISVDSIIDRAFLAKRTVKGRFDVHIATFNDDMRRAIVNEQLVTGRMEAALKNREFEVYLQPQYNHLTGKMSGAEALVRWTGGGNAPIYPDNFIPIFEKNGFIYELDKFVWEEVCKMLRRRIDSGKEVLPVSVNVSRFDFFRHDFFSTVTSLIDEYRLNPELMPLEITECAFGYDTGFLIDMVDKLRGYGFIVEIDDFGSGYSSLNILKDVSADVLKLDMRFISGKEGSKRGGMIIQSVVRMAKLLGMNIVAEGVETKEQADYLTSVGCSLIQGYYYARPTDMEKYEARVDSEGVSEPVNMRESIGNGVLDFWRPDSADSIMFNEYLCGACIIEVFNGSAEVIRANKSFLVTLCTDMTVPELLSLNLMKALDEESGKRFIADVEKSAVDGCRFINNLRVVINDGNGTHVECIRCSGKVISDVGGRKAVFLIATNLSEKTE